MTTPIWASGVHHDGSIRHISNPYPKLDETVTISLRTPATAPIARVYLRAMLDGEFKRLPMAQDDNGEWQVDLTMTQPKIDYRFKLLTDEGASYFYTAKGLSRADSPDFYDFSLLADYAAPTWVHDAIFYQIFPDRFHNGDPSNDVVDGEYERFGNPTVKREWDQDPLTYQEVRSMDFFGGDLQGVTQKLDYLRDLGVTAVYLCPIFTAESNHKYDIIDFWEVDKHFGGNEALAELRAELTKRDMRLMLDITPNHISYANPWLLEAQRDPNAESAEYFFMYGDNQYEMWLGVPSLVKLNYSSPKLRDRMFRDDDSALRFWLKPPYSIDAWRLDVANMTGNLKNLQLDHDVWQEMRSAVKEERADVYLLGEYFQDGTPHLQGDELDASMNYQGFNTPMRRWLGGADLGSAEKQPHADNHPLPTEALAAQWKNFMAAVPYVIALQQFNQIGSHDITRILHVTGGDVALVQLGTALLVAFPGVPCLYYGDEIGLDGGRDPYNRRPFPWDEDRWNSDLREYHQQVLRLRQALPALKTGGYQLLHAAGDLIAFQRHTPDQTVIVAGYRGETLTEPISVEVAVGGHADGTILVDALSNQQYAVENGQIRLDALAHGQALYLVVQPTK